MTLLDVRVDSMRHADAAANLIEDIGLTVNPDEIVAIIGPSGAGKSTLLRIIAGLTRTFAGRVLLDGERLTQPNRRIQLVFQNYRLLPWKNTRDNVAFGAAGAQRTKADDARAWVGRVGLTDKLSAWPKTLSGGETARVALARALVSRPAVLLLDEPFHSLDLINRYTIQHLLLDALQESHAGVIMVSHSVDDAVFLADRIVLVSRAPMTVLKEYPISLPRPRRRSDEQLGVLAAKIELEIEERLMPPNVHSITPRLAHA